MQAVAQQSGQLQQRMDSMPHQHAANLQHAASMQHATTIQHTGGLQHAGPFQHERLQHGMMVSQAQVLPAHRDGDYEGDRGERYYSGQSGSAPPDSPPAQYQGSPDSLQPQYTKGGPESPGGPQYMKGGPESPGPQYNNRGPESPGPHYMKGVPESPEPQYARAPESPQFSSGGNDSLGASYIKATTDSLEPDSPQGEYMRAGYQDTYQYGETSASGSNSGDEDEREYGVDGKRTGAPINGLSSKKRRKQSKPIRLGNDSLPVSGEEGVEDGSDGHEEGELQYRHMSGDSGERPSSPSQADGQAEGPLNLSAATKDVDDKPSGLGLRVLGRELLQNPDGRYNGGEGKERGGGDAYNMMSPFGMPHFMFPFGMSPSSESIPRSVAEQGITPGMSGGRIQIFNPEAYCELCNKEFCNKYFLKTHRANKHGIYSDPPVSSPSNRMNGGGSYDQAGVQPSSLSIGPPPQRLNDHNKDRNLLPPSSSSSSMPPISLPTTPYSISGSFMAMPPNMRPMHPVSDYSTSPSNGTSHLSHRHSQDDPPRPLSNSSLRSPLPSPMRPQSALDRPLSAPINTSSPMAGPPPLISEQRRGVTFHDEAGKSPLNAEGDRESPNTKRMVDGEAQITKHHNEMGSSMGNMPSGLRMPMPGMPPMHPFGSGMFPLPLNPLPPTDQNRKMGEEALRLKDPINLSQHLAAQRPIPNIPNVPQMSSAPTPKGPFTQDKLRQMGVINADAFCEFCCKEFCNKYFLRVHKLKKHGICSPELPPEKVQKILTQMAKEAGKTGQPMPPLTTIIRPPLSLPEGHRSMHNTHGSPLGSPLNIIRPPTLPNFLALPPLDPIPPHHRDDVQSTTSSSDRQDEREEGRAIQFSPLVEPECELTIDEDATVSKMSPLPEHPREWSESSEDNDVRNLEPSSANSDQNNTSDASEGLANLQNMIMKLNNSKPKPVDLTQERSSTVCKRCNKDMENKYFLHAHMMNEHGVLHVEEDGRTPPPPFPQFPTDLSRKMKDERIDDYRSGEMPNNRPSPGLNIPSPLMSRPPSFSSLANGLPKLSEKPHDFPKSIFQQMQGLPRPSFLDQMKRDLGCGLDIPLGPMKRPSLDKDPNRKPASLSRSYCEICKKELCNKYFMKTHMMKMHGINIETSTPLQGGVVCEICKKELSSKYFLKVHMANAHGINEDGSPIPPHLRENGLLNMFPLGELPPPPLGDFSRLLMQQGEKSMEKLKEQNRQERAGMGHICSLCCQSFPDIIALQVHIIKNHGALPPVSGLDSVIKQVKEGQQQDLSKPDTPRTPGMEEDIEEEGKMEIDERPSSPPGNNERSETSTPNNTSSLLPAGPPPFPFPLNAAKLQVPGSPDSLKNLPLNEMLHRQMLSQHFPGLINPLLAGGFPFTPGADPPNQPFSGPLQHVPGGNAEEGSEGHPRVRGCGQQEGRFHSGVSAPTPASRGDGLVNRQQRSRKRFKCSKCKRKFRRRSACLHHIQRNHMVQQGRSLHHSLLISRNKFRKSLSGQRTGSMNIRQLMELHRQLKSRTSNKLVSGKFIAFHASLEGFERLGGEITDASGDQTSEFLVDAPLVYLPVDQEGVSPEPKEVRYHRLPGHSEAHEPITLRLIPAKDEDFFKC